MRQTRNQIPEFKEYQYRYDKESKSYLRSAKPLDHDKLPDQIRVEPNQRKGNVRTDLIVRGNNGGWDDRILTGLGRSAYPLVFYGDHFDLRKKSLLIFEFTSSKTELKVFYFNSYYPVNPALRTSIIDQVMKPAKKGKSQLDLPLRFKNQITVKAT